MKDKPILLGFVCNSPEEENQCYEITDRFFAPHGYRVVRLDVMWPVRSMQAFAARTLGLPDPGDPRDPVKFRMDTDFLAYFLELYEINLAGCLKLRVEQLLGGLTGPRVAVVTTDIRNKVLTTAESMGYRIMRIEGPQPRLHREKSESHLVEGDYRIPQQDFRENGRGRVVRAAIRAVLKRKFTVRT